jgi:hypothetical protein
MDTWLGRGGGVLVYFLVTCNREIYSTIFVD